MAVLTFHWIGKAVSVNRWKNARAIRTKTGAWRATMYETKEYRAFKADIATRLPASRLSGYFDLEVRATLYRLFDTANVLKPVQDALAEAGLIEDDRYIRNVKLVRAYHAKGDPDKLTIILYRASFEGE